MILFHKDYIGDDTVDGNQKSGENSRVEVGRLSTIMYTTAFSTFRWFALGFLVAIHSMDENM